MRSIRTTYTRERFLNALRQSGNVTSSCLVSGIARTAAYSWKRDDLNFSDEWENALSLGLCALEDIAMQMAQAGSEKLIMFLLSARMPERYGQRSTVELNASVSLSLNRMPIDQLRAELATLLGTSQPLTIEADAPTPSQ